MNYLGKDHRAADSPCKSKSFICEDGHHVKLLLENPDTQKTPILFATAQRNTGAEASFISQRDRLLIFMYLV